MRKTILTTHASLGVQFAPPLRVDWLESSHHGCHMNAALAGDYQSPWMNEELAIFRDAVARFVELEMVPNEIEWRKQQNVGKEIWRKAGAMGLLCTDVSAEYGGAGGDFRHETVIYEELSRRGLSGFGQGVHSICAHYLVNHGTEESSSPTAISPISSRSW
jgi:alkylation response protein AidB-like acyl-CoA dehydrogenase